jgi:hypothetical protein
MVLRHICEAARKRETSTGIYFECPALLADIAGIGTASTGYMNRLQTVLQQRMANGLGAACLYVVALLDE